MVLQDALYHSATYLSIPIDAFLKEMEKGAAESAYVAAYDSDSCASHAICPLTIVYFTEEAICNGFPS